MKGEIDSGQKGSCPVCKENIGLLKVPTRMVLRLIAEQEVICTTCRKSVNYEHSAVHACEGAAQALAATVRNFIRLYSYISSSLTLVFDHTGNFDHCRLLSIGQLQYIHVKITTPYYHAT